MSFDAQPQQTAPNTAGLNPFGTGQCLSTKTCFTIADMNGESQSLWNRAMSFDPFTKESDEPAESLNPFGTGQCLST